MSFIIPLIIGIIALIILFILKVLEIIIISWLYIIGIPIALFFLILALSNCFDKEE